MNLANYLSGCLKVLGRTDTGLENFNISRRGVWESCGAVLLSSVFYTVGALAVQKRRAIIAETDTIYALPFSVMAVVFGLYAATFLVTVYILCVVFERGDRFQPWVITRHWPMFFIAFLAALLFGLYMIGILPFMIAGYAAMALYVGTLAIDIRLAQKVGGFEWGAAIFAGCLITALGLTVLLVAVAQFVS